MDVRRAINKKSVRDFVYTSGDLTMNLRTIILLSSIVLAASQDWCNIPWCAPNAHVACNHNGVSPLTFSGQKSISIIETLFSHLSAEFSSRLQTTCCRQLDSRKHSAHIGSTQHTKKLNSRRTYAWT